MKSAEYRKVMKRYRCRRCKLVKWVYRETGWWYDLLCEDCEDYILKNEDGEIHN